MKTTDQIMHQAHYDRGRRECVWKRDPLFQSADQYGVCHPKPRRADARSTAIGFTPKPPSGGFSPPVPQGSGGRSRLNDYIQIQTHKYQRLMKSC
jgi:hypothetical protein